MRNAYSEQAGFVADLAHKTRRLVQESIHQQGLGRLSVSVTFDTSALQTLREAPGSYEAKVFNLVRGLRQETDRSPDTAPMLRPIRERAERVLTDLEARQTTGGAALDEIDKLVHEREEMLRVARQSGLAAACVRRVLAAQRELQHRRGRSDGNRPGSGDACDAIPQTPP